jgi:hypothetical protein
MMFYIDIVNNHVSTLHVFHVPTDFHKAITSKTWIKDNNNNILRNNFTKVFCQLCQLCVNGLVIRMQKIDR